MWLADEEKVQLNVKCTMQDVILILIATDAQKVGAIISK